MSALVGPALAVAAAAAIGRAALAGVRPRLSRQEEWLLGFVAGAACLSVLIAALASAQQARKGAFTLLAAAAVAGALWRARGTLKSLPPLPRPWAALFAAVFLIFGALYFANALQPGMAAADPLAPAVREWQERRLLAFPDGMRMLYLFSLSFPPHAGAAVVHLAFLLALPLMLVCYGRRFEIPGAGVFAAVVAFTAPVAGAAGTATLDDLAVACALFGIFYLIELRAAPAAAVLLGIFALSMRRTPPETLAFRWLRELALWGTESGGLVGPVLLLAPLALLALRDPRGRRLLAVAAPLTLAGASEARWLIPALPFLALAMGIALQRSRGALPVLAMAAALYSWPAVIAVYADPDAWRIRGPMEIYHALVE